MSISPARREYGRAGLTREELDPDPLRQLQRWLDEAVRAQLVEPTAMILATADASGRPSLRTVLLKGLTAGALVYFTNYRSRKGRELAENPHAALLAFWPELERQVEAAGGVARVSEEESAAYFASRPRGAQLSAWASEQSSVIESRDELERRLREVEARYDGRDVPRPPHWGGYRLKPETVQFWQGRPNRLHDRFRYRRSHDGWVIERLAP